MNKLVSGKWLNKKREMVDGRRKTANLLPFTFYRLPLLLITTSYFLLTISCLYGAAFENISIGARPSGMGNAFTAVSDDGNAIYWNPAGLGNLKGKEFVTMHRDLFGLGLVFYDFVGYIQPKIAKGSIGFSWRRLGTTSAVTFMNYAEHTFIISYGVRVISRFCIGTNLKYYLVSYKRKASGIGLDLAFLWDWKKRIKAGMILQDINQPKIRWETNAIDRLPTNLRIGGAANLTNFFTIAADIDNFLEKKWRIYLGSEVWVFNKLLAIRTGGYSRKDRWIFTTGISFSYKFLRLDYGLDKDDSLGNSHIFSLLFRFSK